MVKKRFHYWSTLASLSLLLFSGCCPPFCPTPPPSPPPPFVRVSEVSNGTPQLGEAVTIRWEYGQDTDSGFTPKLKNQIIQLHSLMLDGNVFTETQGCLPASLLPQGEQPKDCLPLENRAVAFDFRGPVMFNLIAIDENDKIYEKIIKLKLPNMSFKASAQMTGWLDGITQVTTLGLPRFGSNFISSFQEKEFERVFGIFENAPDPCADEDGTIRELQSFPLNQLFPRGNPFFLSSNNTNESQNFGATRGGNFPFLDPSFIQSAEGRQFSCAPGNGTNRCRTNADALIFAGTFGVDGTIDRIKTNTGEVEIITPTLRQYEPFFIQIDIRSTNAPQCGSISPQTLVISDVHVGNSAQGLVLSTFRGHISSRNIPTVGEYNFNFYSPDVQQNGETYASTGIIKGALTGFNVHLLNNQDFVPTQATISAEWTNIPIFPDNDISGLKNTYIRFTQ